MKVWIIVGHIIISFGPGGDLPVHHGNTAFASFEACEAWRRHAMSDLTTRTECKELKVERWMP